VNLAVELAGIRLKNPLIAASGTFGYGVEYEGLIDLATLGGIVSKGLYLEPRESPPRIARRPRASWAIGLQGGSANFVKDVLPASRLWNSGLRERVNNSVEEYASPRILDGAPGGWPEINISCPNVKKGGMAFGGDPKMTHEVVAAVRRVTRLPVVPKLSPNVADITLFARVCEEAGASALSCINTLLGLAVDVEKRRPKLAFGTGGLSGPAIRPVAA
jgi:dihydroorotate dehydrogenase (NAD+) catalytic subunit